MKADKDFLNRHLPSFCLTIFVLVVTAGNFTGGIWASFGIGLALILFLSVWRIDGQLPKPDRQFFALALLALLVSAALNLHSTQPKLSWNMWIRLATIFLPLCLLFSDEVQKRATSQKLFRVLPWAAAFGILALAVELALHGPLLHLVKGQDAQLFNYNRGFSHLVILSFPIMAALWMMRRKWFLAFFIIILFIPASLTESRSAKLALVLALLVTGAAFILPTVTRRALMAVPFLLALWPFAAQKLFLSHPDIVDRLPHSWQDRVEIWDYMSYRVFDKPVLGWGLGSSSMLPWAEPHGAMYRVRLVEAPHPHNAVLQLWVELGLPGLAFGILFTLMILHRAGRFDPKIMPFALGAWTAALSLSMIAYNLWTDAFWAAFALTGFAFALLQKRKNAGNF